MKKLLFSIAVLALITFIACSKDDNSIPRPSYTGCQTCEILAINGVDREDYEVCVVKDSVAYVANASTGLTPQEYFSLYCDNAYGVTTEPGDGDGGPATTPGDGGTTTPGVDCVTCAAFKQNNTNVPQTEVCKGTNGHAFVDGTDSGLVYADYITAMNLVTTCK